MFHQSDLITTDIEEYLHQYESKDLLRFLTCGNVDDGKSTLIGRLLYDSKLIFDDHLSALKKDNERVGNAGEKLDLALLVDGLQSEREQGITIDVAYRYFNTDNRKYIIADCPGHEQYTRNMATGASNCDLAIIMIDARYGVQRQTRRHAFICNLLGIKHVVVAINKMDLIGFDKDKYQKIKVDYQDFSKKLSLQAPNVRFVPVSALLGDNVVDNSKNMDWYSGLTLMGLLESTQLDKDKNTKDFRFPVQFVNRPNRDFRGYCGTVASGTVSKGDEVIVLPSGKRSHVKDIITYDKSWQDAYPNEAVTITLEDEIDVSRSDMLVKSDSVPVQSNQFSANIIWFSEALLEKEREYFIRFSTKTISGVVDNIHYEVDLNTLLKKQSPSFGLNSVGNVSLRLTEAVPLDKYSDNPKVGAFVIVDRLTNNTVGAGVVSDFNEESDADVEINYSSFERDLNALICKRYPEWNCKQI